MNIYSVIIAQAIRFCLRLVAGYLAYIGVTSEQQSEFVETTVFVLLPMVILGITEVWSYVQKKAAEKAKELGE